MNKTLGIQKDVMIRNSMINAALKTHKNLTREDRLFVLSNVPNNITNEKLANFILQIYKLSNTGRFSLTFNADLDTHVKARINNRIPILIETAGSDKAWPELYDNKYLNSNEINTIKEMSNREYYAILNTIENANSNGNCNTTEELENILPSFCQKDRKDQKNKGHSDEQGDEELSIKDNKIFSLYSKCYDTVCLYESDQRGKIISLTSDIPRVAYVADSHNNTNTKFCFDVMKLVEQLAKEDYINPQTKIRFSDRTISQLMQKYRKEIAMYKKYLEILSKAGL